MSGGTWNYKQWEIHDLAVMLEERALPLAEFIKTVAETEHIIDWEESGDTARRLPDGDDAEHRLYELWLNTFNRVYRQE
jgi:hypothetical protein